MSVSVPVQLAFTIAVPLTVAFRITPPAEAVRALDKFAWASRVYVATDAFLVLKCHKLETHCRYSK